MRTFYKHILICLCSSRKCHYYQTGVLSSLLSLGRHPFASHPKPGPFISVIRSVFSFVQAVFYLSLSPSDDVRRSRLQAMIELSLSVGRIDNAGLGDSWGSGGAVSRPLPDSIAKGLKQQDAFRSETVQDA